MSIPTHKAVIILNYADKISEVINLAEFKATEK